MVDPSASVQTARDYRWKSDAATLHEQVTTTSIEVEQLRVALRRHEGIMSDRERQGGEADLSRAARVIRGYGLLPISSTALTDTARTNEGPEVNWTACRGGEYTKQGLDEWKMTDRECFGLECVCAVS
ncbi:hypothetical protein CERSUDRAFT_118819 [Gelatoporia subvermispora B]|uniref:Uncharacterized protein n=1 Tax=Ceriporiopsis subvermispora (strain B) TaxID=914234 RepID=M2R1Q8_CERS8|nr:hypothetical protein CERSUDRAFT_118819 [Gelatoporia subvermispora B]